MNLAGRLGLIEQICANPPRVHASTGAPAGVWRTEESCYRFLAEHVEQGSRTMETGLGISTALFAAWGTEHTCVVGSTYEVDLLCAYLDEASIDRSMLEFAVGSSDDVLPTLVPGELDLYLIDGCHGFPFPILDWYYGARWLRPGGWLALDDLQLPSVGNTLAVFLEQDPRWQRAPLRGTWAAYEREAAGSLAEDWTEQGFLGEADEMRQLLRDVMLRTA